MDKRPLPEEEVPEETLFAAATEMTGLIPSGRPNKPERDSYQDVLPWLPHGGTPAPQI
ncbi:MAG: hypothetical protein K5695_16115 [Oscillospiraceae bacterium]|nr:hypothetical protein [Oscillospiraceae bacterium]